MRIADRIQKLKPSATLSVNAKALELKSKGREIISLSVGEPDFPTPPHVVEAAAKAMASGIVRYTQVPGIPELREAAAGYFSKAYGVSAGLENIIVSNGGKQSLYNLFQCLLNPGDEVLIPSPYWVSYPDMMELAEGVPVFVPSSPDKNFLVSPEDLEQKITPRTRALILNSPSNPTGCCYSQEQLLALAELAVNKGLFVISDEIYDQLVYDPGKKASLCKFWEEHQDQVCVCNGLAKSHAMTGWRVGYTMTSPELTKAMSKLQSQSTSNVCTVAQWAAVAALTGDQSHIREMGKAFVRRRDLAHEIISKWPGVVCPKPEGAFYLFPDVHQRYTPATPDSAALCTAIMEKAGVALVPGVAFGDDNCIRISYAVDDDVLVKALELIGSALS